MNQLKGTLYYYGVNMRFSLIMFWSILIGLMLLNLILDLILSARDLNLSFSFAFPIYLFSAIMGFWVIKNIIPYLVKMGVTRMTIYIGSGMTFILLALFNGVVSNTVQTVIKNMLGNSFNSAVELTVNGEVISGSGGLVGLFAENTWWNHFVIDVSVQFMLLVVTFLLGLVFYRYKLIGGAVLIGVLLSIIIYGLTSGWLTDAVLHVIDDFSMAFFYQLLLVGLLLYMSSLILLRKLTV